MIYLILSLVISIGLNVLLVYIFFKRTQSLKQTVKLHRTNSQFTKQYQQTKKNDIADFQNEKKEFKKLPVKKKFNKIKKSVKGLSSWES